MAKKNVTIRLDDNTLAAYLKQYKELTPAVQNAAKVFLQLKRYTMLELKGMFIKQEILVMVDCLKGIARNDEYLRRSVLIANMEYSGTDEDLKYSKSIEDIPGRCEFDPTSFHKKLEALTEAQAYFLMDRIYIFWEMEKRAGKENALDDFVTEMMGK